jgi:tudor domain-containing protein 1/4/6/7
VCIGGSFVDSIYFTAHLQPRIKIVIYDTSSDEDVNLNTVILKEVCQDMSKNIPQLDLAQTYNRVVATHVDEAGDVYCQLEQKGMMQYIEVNTAVYAHRIYQNLIVVMNFLLQKLIYNLVESKFDVDDEHRGLYEQQPDSDTATNQLYLVYDTVGSKW